MFDSFEVRAWTGTYRVSIDPGAMSLGLSGSPDDIVIADRFFLTSNVFQTAAAHLRKPVLFYEACEANKSLEAIPELIEQLRGAGAHRHTGLIAVGGGVIQDMTAFAASIYMRGLRWTCLPTTILGMVDSCIGGKSSINVGLYKNLAGNFHPPREIVIDPRLAATLPCEQQISGLIEAAKICFCAGPECFSQYLACEPGAGMCVEALSSLISLSLRAKKWFVEIDEFDQKERALLNFGHTFGHAIEGASGYKIAHGIAVGIGILCALTYSRECDPTNRDAAPARSAEKLEEHLRSLLGSLPHLPALLDRIPIAGILERFQSDKKHGQEHFVLILLDVSGQAIVQTRAKTAACIEHIARAIEANFASLHTPMSAPLPVAAAAAR